MIRAILFDFDGVLTTDKTGSVSTLRSLSQQTGISEDLLWEAFAPFNEHLLSGRTTHGAVWAKICDRLGQDLDPAILTRGFDSTPIRRDMLCFAAGLRRHYSTGIITDNKADRMQRLTELHSLASIFNIIIVSAEHGSGKEQPSIFESAVESLCVAPHECVFVDNSRRNLVAPAALGMHTLYFNDAIDTAQSLADVLSERYGIVAPRVPPNNSFKPNPLRGSA